MDSDDPGPGDEDASEDDGLDGQDAVSDPGRAQDEDLSAALPAPAWPALPTAIPAGFAAPASGRPAGGMLDLTVPWSTLAVNSAQPGLLGRIGPVTAPQARQLATIATLAPSAEWRVIVISPEGRALAVSRVTRSAARDGPARQSDSAGAVGLVGRVTVIVPEDVLTRPPPAWVTRPAGATQPAGVTQPQR